jgi:acyl dehydratase
VDRATDLVYTHLQALMELSEFRAWLDEDDNLALPVLLKALAGGQGGRATSNELGTRVTLQFCHYCHHIQPFKPGDQVQAHHWCTGMNQLNPRWVSFGWSEWIFEEGRLIPFAG